MNAEKKEIYQQVFDCFDKVSGVVHQIGGMKTRPIIGGAFGSGRFVLASTSAVVNRLHEVHYFVIEADSAAVIGYGRFKDAALQMARTFLTSCDATAFSMYFGRRKALLEKEEGEKRLRIAEAEAEVVARRAKSADKIKSISRRRRQIFEEAQGKCHYCATPLTLDGKWHIEHKFPVALGGTDAPNNLVAACAPCNHEKRDTTDVEYKAKRAARAGLAAMKEPA